MGLDKKSSKNSASSVGSDRKSNRKSRSTSAEGRSTLTKTRRGRRLSSSLLVDEPEAYDFHASLNDIRHAISQQGTRRNAVDESKAKRRSSKISNKNTRDDSGKKSVGDESWGKAPQSHNNFSTKSLAESSAPSSPFNTLARLPTSTAKDKETEEDDFFDLTHSAWADPTKEAVQPSSPRRGKASLSRNAEPPKTKSSLKNNSRWLSEMPTTPRNEVDTTVARPHFSDQVTKISPGPAMVSSTPQQQQQQQKKLDFPLNFLEYTDISPLTVASKNVVALNLKNVMPPTLDSTDA